VYFHGISDSAGDNARKPVQLFFVPRIYNRSHAPEGESSKRELRGRSDLSISVRQHWIEAQTNGSDTDNELSAERGRLAAVHLPEPFEQPGEDDSCVLRHLYELRRKVSAAIQDGLDNLRLSSDAHGNIKRNLWGVSPLSIDYCAKIFTKYGVDLLLVLQLYSYYYIAVSTDSVTGPIYLVLARNFMVGLLICADDWTEYLKGGITGNIELDENVPIYWLLKELETYEVPKTETYVEPVPEEIPPPILDRDDESVCALFARMHGVTIPNALSWWFRPANRRAVADHPTTTAESQQCRKPVPGE